MIDILLKFNKFADIQVNMFDVAPDIMLIKYFGRRLAYKELQVNVWTSMYLKIILFRDY